MMRARHSLDPRPVRWTFECRGRGCNWASASHDDALHRLVSHRVSGPAPSFNLEATSRWSAASSTSSLESNGSQLVSPLRLAA